MMEVASQRYREEHPDLTLKNLARARQAAALVNKARYQQERAGASAEQVSAQRVGGRPD